jgi:glucan-binding YG repeat protein
MNNEHMAPMNPVNTEYKIVTSETLTSLLSALIKAKKQFKPVKKTKKNPFFKSEYAPLDEVLKATEEALLDEGLVVIPLVHVINNKLYLVTTLFHKSGEFISSYYPLPTTHTHKIKDKRREKIVNDYGEEKEILVDYVVSQETVPIESEPQELASANTYARRNAYMTLLNITAANEDDDGNAASNRRHESNSSSQSGLSTTQQKPRETATRAKSPQKLTQSQPVNQVNKKPATATSMQEYKERQQEINPLYSGYLKIASLCNINAAENSEARQKIESDPGNFSDEIEQLARLWFTNKYNDSLEFNANEFWDYVKEASGSDPDLDTFVKIFQDWQTNTESTMPSDVF